MEKSNTNKKSFIFAIDFDNTVVHDAFPKVGCDVSYAVIVLKKLTEEGHRIILYTMRSGEYLEDAVKWYEERGIPLWGINENPEQTESKWSTSPKPYADYYIDDRNVGTELTANAVDWFQIHENLVAKRILTPPTAINDYDVFNNLPEYMLSMPQENVIITGFSKSRIVSIFQRMFPNTSVTEAEIEAFITNGNKVEPIEKQELFETAITNALESLKL